MEKLEGFRKAFGLTLIIIGTLVTNRSLNRENYIIQEYLRRQPQITKKEIEKGVGLTGGRVSIIDYFAPTTIGCGTLIFYGVPRKRKERKQP